MAAIAFFPFEFPEIPQVACAFTSRRGGVSEPPHDSANISFDVGDDPAAVAANRRMAYARMGLTGWCELNQVHGDAIRFEPTPHAPDEHADQDGDGMATTTPGHGLVVKTADCQPILLAHRSGKYVAGLHAGWRGNKCDFPGSGVRRFCEHYGIEPEDVFAVRGPSLGPSAAEFVNFETDFGPAFRDWYDREAKTMDLWQLTRDQLMNAGVPEAQIYGLDLCTMTMEETFFSYRKACASPVKETGRQCGIIWIRP